MGSSSCLIFISLLSSFKSWRCSEFAFTALEFNPARASRIHFPRVKAIESVVRDRFFYFYFSIQMFRWTDLNEHRTRTWRCHICETHVDGKTENTASVEVGYRRICVSSCARIWRHWALSSPFLSLGVMPSMWVMTTVGNTWSLNPSAVYVYLALMRPSVYIAQIHRKK